MLASQVKVLDCVLAELNVIVLDATAVPYGCSNLYFTSPALSVVMLDVKVNTCGQGKGPFTVVVRLVTEKAVEVGGTVILLIVTQALPK